MVAAAWYYVKDEAVTGPMDRMTLMEHTFTGEVEADTLIWSAWDDRPRPIHAVPEFSNLLSVTAIQRSPGASASLTSPLLARVSGASWVLLGGMSLVVLMVIGVLMLRNDGAGAWRMPVLLFATTASVLLVRSGHLTLQGRRDNLRTPGLTTFFIGALGFTLTLSLEAMSGFGSFAFFAFLLMVSGLSALIGDRAYRSWYVAEGN